MSYPALSGLLDLSIIHYTPGRCPGLWYAALSGLELPSFQGLNCRPFSSLDCRFFRARSPAGFLQMRPVSPMKSSLNPGPFLGLDHHFGHAITGMTERMIKARSFSPNSSMDEIS
jgi:hypothetical protein